MQRLLLVRHGEAEHQVKNMSGGWTDTPLTDLGVSQAAKVGHALAVAGIGPDMPLYSSDLIRTKQTADAISRATGQSVVTRQELREQNLGAATNLSAQEAARLERPITEPVIDWVEYHGAESWRDMTTRIGAVLSEMSARHREETVVVVSHRNSMIAAVCWWLGLSEEYWSKVAFEFDPASITKLAVSVWGKLVVSLNDTAHLAGGTGR